MSRTQGTLYVAEPPVAYLVRPPLVVDCSAICGILFDEPWRTEATTKLAGRTLFAPNLLDYEVVSVALKKHRQQWPRESLAKAMSDYNCYQIELVETNAKEQLDLAIRYDLSSYDAAYLWLAAELKAPLATFDKKLGRAAEIHLAGLS